MKNRIGTSIILIMVVSILLIATPTPARAQAPWFDDGWGQRKSVSITGVSGAGTDYQVFLYVTYDSDMQPDFDDLRFTGNDGLTLLDHWTEAYSVSAYAYVWVEVTDSLDSDRTIYMYYGNTTVSDASNGTAVFLFYEDWSSESVDPLKWDTITSAGSIAFDDTDANHGSVIQVSGNAGTNVYEIRAVPTSVAPISVIGRVKLELTVAASQRTLWGMGSTGLVARSYIFSNEGSKEFSVIDEDSHDDSQTLFASQFDTYHSFMITRDGTLAKLYSDYILIATATCDADVGASVLITILVRDSEYQVFMDWSAQRKFIANGPTGGIFGNEEAYFDAQLTIDGMLILLGLVMIPVSTLYLAYGAKHDRSSDRLYYGIVMFMLGCALFIGGILPP